MPVKTIESKRYNVVDAAKIKLRNLLNSGVKCVFSYSAGKDSLCICELLRQLIMGGEVDKSNLQVIFFDEEGIWPSMEEAALEWRQKFLKMGVPFTWYCLPVKQVSIFQGLAASESWITWDPAAKDAWIREPPQFAVMSHPLLEYPGQYNYQTFSKKAFNDCVMITGVRADESVQRRQSLAASSCTDMADIRKMHPIADWKDKDVWLFIKENNLNFPEAYLKMYENGAPRSRLRLCAFFGENGFMHLAEMPEIAPDLWERVLRREPNAYLVAMYWDSEMFRHQSAKRKELEAGEPEKDYKALAWNLVLHPEENNVPYDTAQKISVFRRVMLRYSGKMTEKHYRKLYEGIKMGDPKLRTLRAVMTNIAVDYAEEVR